MKIKPELACFIDVWEEFESEIESAFVLIDMEFIGRYFDYYYLGNREIHQIMLHLGDDESESLENLVYLVGVGKSWNEFKKAFHGYMFYLNDEVVEITPNHSPIIRERENSRPKECVRITDSDRIYFDAPLMYLYDLSKTLSGMDYMGYAEAEEEFIELMELFPFWEECVEGLLIGDNIPALVYNYILLRGAARASNMEVKKAIKRFSFYLTLEGGDIGVILSLEGKCKLEVDINLHKPEICRKEVELTSKTIKLLIPNWIEVEGISKEYIGKKI